MRGTTHHFSLYRSIRTFLVLFALFAPCIAPAEESAKREELVFFNWSAEYIDQDVIKEFEEKYNVTVRGVYFETGEMRNEMIAINDGKGYDVTIIERHRLPSYIRSKWIAPLPTKDIPNLKYIDERWMPSKSNGKLYAVPYLWGTVGIAYRSDLVSSPITSWMHVLQPKEELRQKILMVKDSTDTIGVALKALGYSSNSTDRRELEEAEKLLLKQKPYVRTYSTLKVSKESKLVSGELLAAMTWNGDALALQEFNPAITYIIPDEGSALWVDLIVILQSSHKKKLAAAFINFLHEPRNAARITAKTNFATTNKAALQFVPTEILENKTIFPSDASVAQSEFNETLPPRAVKLRNAIFSKFLHN